MGPQTALLTEAQRCLSLSEAGSKKQLKASKYAKPTTKFPPGTEWELLNSDAVILLGLNHALRCVPFVAMSSQSNLTVTMSLSIASHTWATCNVSILSIGE